MVISYAMVLCLPQVTRCDVYFLNLDKFVQLNGIVTVMEHIFRYVYMYNIYILGVTCLVKNVMFYSLLVRGSLLYF